MAKKFKVHNMYSKTGTKKVRANTIGLQHLSLTENSKTNSYTHTKK